MNTEPAFHLHQLIRDLNNIKSHPDNWWIEHDYEKINEQTYENVYEFLKLSPSDYILSEMQILVQYNATLVLYWHTSSIIASVNIGDDDFSYVIYSILHNLNINSDSTNINNKDSINDFYKKLSRYILT